MEGTDPLKRSECAAEKEQAMQRPLSNDIAKRREFRPVLFACDGAYATQLATCLRSMTESNRSSWPIDAYILAEEFPENSRKQVFGSLPPGSISINWISADTSRFAGFATADYISRMTFARLLIPNVMPENTSRMVYLDADILVLDDLSALWEVDLEDRPIGAVLDELDAHIKANTAGFENVPRVKSYFNAGVLVIDLQRWRQEKVSENALEYLLHCPSSPYSDQDALNVVCDGRWKELEARWNYQGHLRGRIQDLGPEQSPAIVHFVTTLKPWKPTSLSANALLYDSFRKRTLFARTTIEVCADSLLSFWLRIRRCLGRFVLLRALRDRLWSMVGRRPGRSE